MNLKYTFEKLWRIHYYLKDGEPIWHRDDGPALEYFDGGVQYWIHGKLHREDGPAIITADGLLEWYKNGEIHRDDGPAFEDPKVGLKMWYRNGILHRENGPAIERSDNVEEWFFNGKLHRLDGPASSDGEGNQEWHVDGHRIYCENNEEFLRLVKLKLFW
jgi:hypothetical protein